MSDSYPNMRDKIFDIFYLPGKEALTSKKNNFGGQTDVETYVTKMEKVTPKPNYLVAVDEIDLLNLLAIMQADIRFRIWFHYGSRSIKYGRTEVIKFANKLVVDFGINPIFISREQITVPEITAHFEHAIITEVFTPGEETPKYLTYPTTLKSNINFNINSINTSIKFGYLCRILKNTVFLMGKMGLWDKKDMKIKEVNFYGPIKAILEPLFPNMQNSDGRNSLIFTGTTTYATKFKPDILLEDINTAIEYKLIKDDKDIDDYIDQIIIDVVNYKDMSCVYKIFICVLCIINTSVTEARVEQAWNKKINAENWILIISR